MTFRPLFVDLNLMLSKLSTRFSRSKSSGVSSSKWTSKEGDSHLQWPGTQTRQKDNAMPVCERLDTKCSPHVLTVDLGIEDHKHPYTQV